MDRSHCLANSVQAQSAKAIVDRAAKAMGGMNALRAIRNEVIESEGKQFDSASTPQPLGPTRQISTFRYTLTRDLTQPRLRLEWEGGNSARNETIRFVEVIDGDTGSLREGAADTAKVSRLHPGRLATRLREEKRAPAKLLLTAANQKSLRRRADAEVNGQRNYVLSFIDNNDEFHLYIDAKTIFRRRSTFSKTIPSKVTAAMFCAMAIGVRAGRDDAVQFALPSSTASLCKRNKSNRSSIILPLPPIGLPSRRSSQ